MKEITMSLRTSFNRLPNIQMKYFLNNFDKVIIVQYEKKYHEPGKLFQ